MKFSNNCPMPKLDFDVITMGHGSGGVLTHKLLDKGVFSLLSNDLLDQKHDGAVFQIDGPMAFSTDSYVVNPIFFPGGNIGDLAVNGTVNDLAMCGAQPKYLSLSFILEEGLKMEEFWEVLVSIKEAAEKAGVQIVTGDTKVVDRGKADKIFINTSGVGQVLNGASIGIENVKPGDKIIVSGEIANHGIAVMSVREGLEFETDILTDSRPLNDAVKELIDQYAQDIHLLRDPTRGGVSTVLNEIAQQGKVGVDIEYRLLPLNESVEGACEMLGLDPLYVANEGVFLAIVSGEKAEAIVKTLQSIKGCEQASIIGEVTDEHIGKVISTSPIMGRRVIGMLPGEQLPRIC